MGSSVLWETKLLTYLKVETIGHIISHDWLEYLIIASSHIRMTAL
jgi:hypothetical protein